MSNPKHIASFSAAYAAAVVAFLRSDASQAVYFDRKRGVFDSYQQAAGTAPDDVSCHVGDEWAIRCGQLLVPMSPDVPGFSESQLAAGIINALEARDGIGEYVESLVAYASGN